MRIWTFRLQQLISWTLGAAKSKIICQQQSVTFTSNRHGLKEWKSYQLWISWRELRAWQPFVLTLPSWQKEQVMLYDFALSLANRSFFFLFDSNFRGRCSTSHIFRQLVKKIQKRKRGKEKGKKESPKWKVEESKEKNSSLFIKKTVWWSMFECEFRKEGKRFSS